MQGSTRGRRGGLGLRLGGRQQRGEGDEQNGKVLQALRARLSQVSVFSNTDALDPDCLGKCGAASQKPER